MKTTAQRLREVYCKPKTQQEWDLIKLYNPVDEFCVEYIKRRKRYSSKPKSSKTEISVSYFIDLIEDKIVAWRLVEDGFDSPKPESELTLDTCKIVVWNESDIDIDKDGKLIPVNVKTYTDLITLINLLK
jgi:hypothetical protein